MILSRNLKNLRISSSEKLGLVSNLATMLTAGLPILEVVDSLLEDAKGNQKRLLESLKADLSQGNHVATAFEKFPNVFDKITVNLIRASEEAGTLDVTLTDLKETIKRETEFGDKVKSALTYPIVILFVFLGVLLMILIVVIPKISIVFSRLKVELPLPTRVMIAASEFMTKNTSVFIACTVIFIVGIFFLYRRQKKLFLNMLFKLPVVNTLAKQIDLTRFTRSLYLLLNAGLPIPTALELAGETVMRKDIHNAIVHSKELVLTGKRLSEGLNEARNAFPTIIIKIVEAGEKSGSLDKSMLDASEYLDYQVSKTLKTLTTLLEPIMLVFVGGLVGGMMLAIIAPIYGMIGQVGAR